MKRGEMTENSINDPEPKRPNFLVAIIVLSSVSIVSSLYSTLKSLFAGPMDKDQVDVYLAEQMESISLLRDQGADDIADMVMDVVDMSIYQNNEVFYSFNVATLLALFVGAASMFLMFRLKKLGFHLYVAYSLLPIIWFYVFLPGDIIPNFLVFGSLFISAVFIVLYALNLKHMK